MKKEDLKTARDGTPGLNADTNRTQRRQAVSDDQVRTKDMGKSVGDDEEGKEGALRSGDDKKPNRKS